MSGQFTTFWQIPAKKNNYNYVIYYILTDSRQKNNYNYVRGNLLPFDRFQTKKLITIMWEGNLLHFDRFQTKKIITIMREGNLLPFDRFQTKKLQLCERANYYLLTDSRQKNNYNYVRGQFTTFWQIPAKKNNYKKIYYLLTFQTKK